MYSCILINRDNRRDRKLAYATELIKEQNEKIQLLESELEEIEMKELDDIMEGEIQIIWNESEKPAYYAVIPSGVRYCEELKYAERLLYGEITALTGKQGYCFATNKYFAGLYHVATETISRWISHLNKLGFIKVEIIKNQKNEIIERRIFIVDNSNNTFVANTYCQNNQYPYGQDNQYSIDAKVKDNNINTKIDRFFNTIIINENAFLENKNKKKGNYLTSTLKRLEFDYTKEMIESFTDDNIEKIKNIIYCVKMLIDDNRKTILDKLTREELINIYDNCKVMKLKYEDTNKEINNFFEYYYISVIKKIRKS